MFRLTCPNCDWSDLVNTWKIVKEMAKGNCPNCHDSSKAIVRPYNE